jgi:MFS family permease
MWLEGDRDRRQPMRGMIGLVIALGIAQILSWGSLYYSISVLGGAMRAELGVSELFLFGAYTAGLLVSGAISPVVGRLIDRRGGRFVMSSGSILGALAMTVLGCATNAATLVVGWLIAGAAMAATLYDPAFATLSQHTGDRYRRAVTLLTLLGGFASTVFWPFALFLLQGWGWREACVVFAALHLLVGLPIHAWLVPPRPAREAQDSRATAARSPAFESPSLPWLNASFAIVNFVAGVLAVRMVELLTGVGMTTEQAVAASMLMGPMQVAGRVLEMTFLKRFKATAIGTLSMALIVTAIVVLGVSSGNSVLAIAFVIAYGCGNGIFTIVRGATPAEIFGPRGLGELLGHLSRPSQFARALAPAAYSLLLTLGLTQSSSMALLAAVLLAGIGCYAMATRYPAPQRS